ncbi:hypothetical protein [Beijerinckia indica]|uniref:Uncharacterized protein n=1 Tax=Beijerinckia indica subsp. indica (strain ATCC 9039 / DSM 1715 / NCIMB 8712) TaxID=395963 RepID=B2IAW1_BEII9|nr:hypothetical protein [Beijerinckia indica]ACB93661.1 hypothetical protein Bind_0002 [Beijerinckia indica subsp. indica ATCC 9039]
MTHRIPFIDAISRVAKEGMEAFHSAALAVEKGPEALQKSPNFFSSHGYAAQIKLSLINGLNGKHGGASSMGWVDSGSGAIRFGPTVTFTIGPQPNPAVFGSIREVGNQTLR